jgi:tetratricopeptide (TPR) repeat protein
MWFSFTVLSTPSRTHSYSPCLSVLPLALLFSLLLLASACVKRVHSVSNDNFYIVRANNAQAKDRPHRAKSHPEPSSKSEMLQGSKAVNAKTSITNPDVLEQKHPVVASLLEKIQHDPNNPQNHYELASVYHRLQIFDKALLEYEKAIEAASENPEYYEGVGRLWRDWGTPTSGINYLQKALDLRSSYPEAWNTLGTIYDQLRNFSQAQRCYLNALVLNSELDFVYSNLSFSYLQTGEVQEAIYYGERAVQLNPNLIQARNNLGAAYGMADDFVRAIEQFKLIGDEAEAHNNLGVLLLKKQRNVEAMEEFKLAVRQKPFYRVAAQNYRTARSLVVRNRPLQKHSALVFTDWLPLDVSFGADSLDFSIPLVDLQFIQACGYLWASGPEQRNQELLAHPRAYADKEYEISPALRRTIFARNQPADK